MYKAYIRLTIFLFAVTLFLPSISGCAAQPQTSVAQQKHKSGIGKRARSMEAAGVMSSADYEHIQQLNDKIARDKTLEESDVDWVLSAMKEPSSAPAVLHVHLMALFLDMRTFTPTQREKIRAAISPLLSSADKLDQQYAGLVLKKVG